MRGTSKYDALRDHLLMVGAARVAMSISEIEDVLGFELCEAAGSPSWWANTKRDAGRAQRRAWRTAGYNAFLSSDGESVEFTRAPALD